MTAVASCSYNQRNSEPCWTPQCAATINPASQERAQRFADRAVDVPLLLDTINAGAQSGCSLAAPIKLWTLVLLVDGRSRWCSDREHWQFGVPGEQELVARGKTAGCNGGLVDAGSGHPYEAIVGSCLESCCLVGIDHGLCGSWPFSTTDARSRGFAGPDTLAVWCP